MPVPEPGRIGVFPAAARDEYAHLFSALEQALPVRFVDHRDAGAVIAIGADSPRADLPALSVPSASATRGGTATISFSREEGVPVPLRGRRLVDHGPRAAHDEPPDPADRLLGGSMWRERTVSSGARWQVSSYPLPRLGPSETLRDHLRPGRFMGLLPLLALLRGPEPQLRACVILDDPNLHWPSYGHVDYRRLVEHVRAGGYHVAFATVPRDSWLVNRRAARLLRAHREFVSLLVHGNDHTAHELGRLCDGREAERVMAQALRRTTALERRAGLAVDRVMAPPHERCSEQALAAMLSVGFEAACIGRPHPWRDEEPPASPLLGWRPAEFVAGGLPVLPRYALRSPRDELVFRALLGQPLLLYGHHGDLADGYQALDLAAESVDGLGDVRWGSVGSIARSNFTARRRGDTLALELCSRRVSVDVPDGVEWVSCRTPEVLGEQAWRGLSVAGQLTPPQRSAGATGFDPVPVGGRRRLELELVPERSLDPATVASPPTRAWPLVRRLLAEGRDRARATAPGPRRGRVVMLLQNNPYPQDTRVRNEAETLAGDGREVTVIAPLGPGQAPRAEVADVRVHRYRSPVSDGSVRGYLFEYAVAHLKLVTLALKELAKGAEVVHFHGPPDTLAVAGVAARLLRRRAVFDLHDSGPELFAAKFGATGRPRALLAAAQRAAVRTASLVIVTNESQRQLVSDHDTPVVVVRNGPRAAEFGRPVAAPRPGELRDPHLVYVGALDVQDGVLELPELLAMPELRGARLTVVGDGPLASELAERCAAHQLDGRVTLTGQVAHESIPGLIAAADIGIDPAPGTELNHGSTMIKVSEYLAVGRPVVAYRLRETARTAGEAGVYAPCGDRSAFAALIRELARDGPRRLELGRRARRRAAELMWERSAAALCEAYAGLS